MAANPVCVSLHQSAPVCTSSAPVLHQFCTSSAPVWHQSGCPCSLADSSPNQCGDLKALVSFNVQCTYIHQWSSVLCYLTLLSGIALLCQSMHAVIYPHPYPPAIDDNISQNNVHRQVESYIYIYTKQRIRWAWTLNSAAEMGIQWVKRYSIDICRMFKNQLNRSIQTLPNTALFV